MPHFFLRNYGRFQPRYEIGNGTIHCFSVCCVVFSLIYGFYEKKHQVAIISSYIY